MADGKAGATSAWGRATDYLLGRNTLIGVASANVFYLPIATKLKQISDEESHARALILEGILSIQAGDNPRVVQEKLITFVPPGLRPAEGESMSPSASAQKEAA